MLTRGGIAIALLLAALALFGCGRSHDPAKARTVRVAAAADLQFALQDLAAEFQKQYPAIRIVHTYGSSGNFYAQLSNHAPFDLFLSADAQYPQKLVDAKLASPDSQFAYAVGRIVLWVPKDSPLDVTKLGMDALTQPAARKIAIANPQHAPYGRAAEAALKKLGYYDRVRDRLVFSDNVAQTVQFVQTGSADIGIIALSLALAPPMKDQGAYWNVPLDAYPALEQGGVILSWAQDADATEKFKAFLTAPAGRAILKRYGFVLPGD
jgi:molybdate transport system substrate-binding protein